MPSLYKNPYQHASLVVNAYDQRTGFDPRYSDLFLRTCDMIASSNDRLGTNYSRMNFGFDGHMTIDMLLDDDGNVAEFEGVFRRDWWPRDVYRIKNRYYVAEDYRHPNMHYDRPTETRLLTQHQIEKARSRGAKALFVSIEGPKALQKMRFIMRTMVPYWNSGLDWKIPGRYFKVADCDSQPCWQQIIYANMAPGYDLAREPWFMDSRSIDEWKEMPQ